jgi:hypothetical protein
MKWEDGEEIVPEMRKRRKILRILRVILRTNCVDVATGDY